MLPAPPRHGVEGILYVLTLMLRHQVLGVLPLLGSGYTVLYLPAPCPLPVAPHDFSRSPELIAQGHAMASAFLRRVHVDGGGIYGHPHFHLQADGATPPHATAPARVAAS
jgi:NTE family protein